MIDWQRVFLNLRNTGLSFTTIAGKVGMEPRTAQRYARGDLSGDPRFTQALLALDLHAQFCPQQHSVSEIGEP